jgi:osmoprotectant transport system ATP-binding protein
MDEPFGALDPKTQEQLQSEFANLKRMLKKTIVFVTHDVYEAVIMGDKIAILKDGELQQYVEPLQIWHNPANDFVASFVGAEFGFHVFPVFA